MVKYEGIGRLATVSFYALGDDNPFPAGVTIERTLAGGAGCGPRRSEKWLPIDRTSAMGLLPSLGKTVRGYWDDSGQWAEVIVSAGAT